MKEETFEEWYKKSENYRYHTKETIELAWNHQAKKIAERDEELVKLRQHLSLAVEGLRFYADKQNWEEKHKAESGCFDVISVNDEESFEEVCNIYGGKTAREILKQIGETE